MPDAPVPVKFKIGISESSLPITVVGDPTDQSEDGPYAVYIGEDGEPLGRFGLRCTDDGTYWLGDPIVSSAKQNDRAPVVLPAGIEELQQALQPTSADAQRALFPLTGDEAVDAAVDDRGVALRDQVLRFVEGTFLSSSRMEVHLPAGSTLEAQEVPEPLCTLEHLSSVELDGAGQVALALHRSQCRPRVNMRNIAALYGSIPSASSECAFEDIKELRLSCGRDSHRLQIESDAIAISGVDYLQLDSLDYMLVRVSGHMRVAKIFTGPHANVHTESVEFLDLQSWKTRKRQRQVATLQGGESEARVRRELSTGYVQPRSTSFYPEATGWAKVVGDIGLLSVDAGPHVEVLGTIESVVVNDLGGNGINLNRASISDGAVIALAEDEIPRIPVVLNAAAGTTPILTTTNEAIACIRTSPSWKVRTTSLRDFSEASTNALRVAWFDAPSRVAARARKATKQRDPADTGKAPDYGDVGPSGPRSRRPRREGQRRGGPAGEMRRTDGSPSSRDFGR